MEAQGKDKISEGEAMMKAYAKQAESDLLALPEEVQAQARAAMEKIVGKQDGGFESVAAKIVMCWVALVVKRLRLWHLHSLVKHYMS